jgi:SAM-dependent methyltransferase
MKLDYDRIKAVLDSFRGLAGDEAYYLKDSVDYEHVGPLVPQTQDVLARALSGTEHVLDIGCGDGRTLIANHTCFAKGTGIDESSGCMIPRAIHDRDAKGISNLDFQACKAVHLPFAGDAFDMVFSERGPLGYSDATLAEALRVLRPGGLIFVETLGERNLMETSLAFDLKFVKPETHLANLEGIRQRFEKVGVAVQTLASRTEALRFKDFYGWLKYQCSVWTYLGKPLPSPDAGESFEKLLAIASDKEERIKITYHTLWIAGTKT